MYIYEHMNQKTMALLVTSIIMVLAGCSLLTVKTESYENKEELRLSISSDKKIYKTGEEIWIEFTLENTGSREINIFDSFKEHELGLVQDLEIITPSNNRLKYEGEYIDRVIVKDNYLRMIPKQVIGVKKKISECFNFSILGKYKITGIYENVLNFYHVKDETTGKVTGELRTVDAWEGVICSNTITIAIIK